MSFVAAHAVAVVVAVALFARGAGLTAAAPVGGNLTTAAPSSLACVEVVLLRRVLDAHDDAYTRFAPPRKSEVVVWKIRFYFYRARRQVKPFKNNS